MSSWCGHGCRCRRLCCFEKVQDPLRVRGSRATRDRRRFRFATFTIALSSDQDNHEQTATPSSSLCFHNVMFTCCDSQLLFTRELNLLSSIMPAGFTRLNERKQRPNQNIAFIKPLESADKAIAQDFLDRIASICAPIMKANHLVVTSLEEFPPNREFWVSLTSKSSLKLMSS
jgi:hypothetical protein